MAVPTAITDLSVTATSNSPSGVDVAGITSGPDDFFRAAFAIIRRLQAQGANVASAATVDLGAIADGNYVHITGTTTITSFGTVAAGVSRIVVFDGALTLTHNAASLILPGGANITTAAGDAFWFVSEGSGNWRCIGYLPAAGYVTAATVAAGYQPLDATLTALAGTLTAANKIPYATALNTASELDFKDEDNMASNSATALPSQQSVKAYADTKNIATQVAPTTAGNVLFTTDGSTRGATQKIVSGTAVSASGTSVDFTGIPSWVKRITVMFSGLSTNGTSTVIVQLGDSGGIETTGYFAGYGTITTAGVVAAGVSTGGFRIFGTAAATLAYGTLTFSLLDSSTNTWLSNGNAVRDEATDIVHYNVGSKSLSATLTQVRITTEGGTDTFDAGTINILYE